MIRRVTEPFSPASQPLMTRQSYRHELLTVMLFPIAMSLVEGGVITVLATRLFNVGDIAFATIFAAPMFANLTSFFWTKLSKKRRKIRMISILQCCLLFCLIGIACLPINPTGALLLVLLVVLSRCCMAGFATLRSTVWRQNYPKRLRAQITSKFVLITSLMIALGPVPVYFLLDQKPEWYRYLYISLALLGAVGVWSYSKIRLRQEKELINFEKAEANDNSLPSTSFIAVLKNDRFFRWYMVWQFFAGLGNMIGEIAIIALILKWTAHLTNTDGSSICGAYLIPILLSTTIPMIVAVMTLPLWARYMDRVHITQFRTRHAFTWVFAQFGYWIVGYLGIWQLVTIPRIIQGLARSGGLLAWNLGHNDFADRRLVTVYMGIHVTLTGVRGFFGPYLGMLLFAGWSSNGFLSFLPEFDGIGYHIFLLTTFFCLVAQLGFFSLHRMVKRQLASAQPQPKQEKVSTS